MKKVILVSGKLRSGKNQFSDYLKKELEAKGLKVGTDLFAKDLKDGCNEDFKNLSNVLFNISEEIKAMVNTFDNIKFTSGYTAAINQICNKLLVKDENWYENKTEITRSLLQIYGTEIFRKRVDDNWWVNLVRNRCEKSDYDVIIITDARFPNEIEVVSESKEYETYCVRISRHVDTNQIFATHDSEIALDDWSSWDFIIDNSGTLEDLNNASKTVCNYLTEEKDENDYVDFFTKNPKGIICGAPESVI